MKTILCFNFLLTVWLSVSFRVGLFMFGFLLLNLQYFWRSHSAFFNKAEESGLDHKIIGRKMSLIQVSKLSTGISFPKRV